MLEAAMLMEHIDLLLSNEDVKKCKPDPEMYLEAMRILGVEPKTSLIIEDNEHGIQAGRASGGNVLAVKGYHEVNWDLIESQLLRREIHA
jgi:HAD superfamily hydrolase (TIGR01509 family)